MNPKVYILIAILSTALSYTLDNCVAALCSTDSVTTICGGTGEILPTDSHEAPRHSDIYETAYSPLASAFSPARQGNPSGFARQSGQRLGGTNPGIVVKSGKVTGSSTVGSFLSSISLFPSGIFSLSHYFIRFHRLTI